MGRNLQQMDIASAYMLLCMGRRSCVWAVACDTSLVSVDSCAGRSNRMGNIYRWHSSGPMEVLHIKGDFLAVYIHCLDNHHGNGCSIVRWLHRLFCIPVNSCIALLSVSPIDFGSDHVAKIRESKV